MDICKIKKIQYSIYSLFSMKISLAAPSVCPELYSYMHFLDLSFYRIISMELYTVCLFPTYTISDCKANGQSNHTSSMIAIPKTNF